MKQRLFQFVSIKCTLPSGRKRILFFPTILFFKTPLFEGFFLACKKPFIALFHLIARGELK